MKNYFVVSVTILLSLATSVVIASDFYGASIFDRDVPTIAWKSGITGIHPIINYVPFDSPASKAGFNKGDIILSINNSDIRKTSELSKFTASTLSILVFRDNERRVLTIDRSAVEKEIADRIAANKKAATPAPQQIVYANMRPDKSPPLKFDNATLDKKYGKSYYKPSSYVNNINSRVIVTGSLPLAGGFTGSSVVESQIEGEFEGWDGETIFKLVNGQIWQQSSYDYNYHYSYYPKVLIYYSKGSYKLKVDGVKGTIEVVRIK